MAHDDKKWTKGMTPAQKKKFEKKSRKRDVVGIILQEDLYFFPEVY